MQSNDDQAEHSFWNFYGLGLQDKDGAIARDRIEFETPQATVDDAVNACLHASLEHEHPVAPDSDVTAPHCKSLYGYCATSEAFHPTATKLARMFAKFCTDRCLFAGSLVKLRPVFPSTVSEGTLESTESLEGYFFLGVHCRRPLQQVLVKAWPSGQGQEPGNYGKFSLTQLCAGRAGASSEEALQALPAFSTSYEVFRLLAVQCNGNLETVAVDILDYILEAGLWSIERLEVTVTGSSGSVSLQTSVTPAAKQKVELPFGLQHAKTKRKRKPRNPPTNPRARAKARGHGRGRGGRGRRQVASSSSSSSSSSSDSSSQSDPSRDDSALSSDSDEDRRPAEYADDDEAEAIAMPNAAAVDEAAVLREAEVELRADHLRRQQLAETHVRGGTYFVRQIGFDEGSVAPTCRSVCYHCGQKIAKGASRFSYFWNERRPSRYMHATCVVHFIDADPAAADARKVQAVEAMSRIAQSANADQQVISAAEHLRSVLRSEAASSAVR